MKIEISWEDNGISEGEQMPDEFLKPFQHEGDMLGKRQALDCCAQTSVACVYC